MRLVPVGSRFETTRIDRHGIIADAAGSRLGQQALNDHFRLLVGALAEMVVPHASLRVDEIKRRPIIVVEGPPNRILAVDRDGIVDPQRFDLPPHVVDVLFKLEFRRVDADDDQSLVLVLLRPSAKVGLRAQPVDAGVGPEMDENDFSPQGRRRQRRRIEPLIARAREASSEWSVIGPMQARERMRPVRPWVWSIAAP